MGLADLGQDDFLSSLGTLLLKVPGGQGTRLVILIQLLPKGLGLPGRGTPAVLPDAGNPDLPVTFQAIDFHR